MTTTAADKPYRVLIIDRMRGRQRILGKLLQLHLEYLTVSSADSAETALQAIGRRRYNLIISALHLTECDALYFAEQVQQDPRHRTTIFIVLSGALKDRRFTVDSSKGVLTYFDQSLGYQRLINYLRWLLPPVQTAVLKLLCLSLCQSSKLTVSTEYLNSHHYNLQLLTESHEAVVELQANLDSKQTPFDGLVVEIDSGSIEQALSLIYHIRHDLHLPPVDLAVLVFTREQLDGYQFTRFYELGCKNVVNLAYQDNLLASPLLPLLLNKNHRLVN